MLGLNIFSCKQHGNGPIGVAGASVMCSKLMDNFGRTNGESNGKTRRLRENKNLFSCNGTLHCSNGANAHKVQKEKFLCFNPTCDKQGQKVCFSDHKNCLGTTAENAIFVNHTKINGDKTILEIGKEQGFVDVEKFKKFDPMDKYIDLYSKFNKYFKNALELKASLSNVCDHLNIELRNIDNKDKIIKLVKALISVNISLEDFSNKLMNEISGLSNKPKILDYVFEIMNLSLQLHKEKIAISKNEEIKNLAKNTDFEGFGCLGLGIKLLFEMKIEYDFIKFLELLKNADAMKFVRHFPREFLKIVKKNGFEDEMVKHLEPCIVNSEIGRNDYLHLLKIIDLEIHEALYGAKYEPPFLYKKEQFLEYGSQRHGCNHDKLKKRFHMEQHCLKGENFKKFFSKEKSYEGYNEVLPYLFNWIEAFETQDQKNIHDARVDIRNWQDKHPFKTFDS